MSRSRQRLRDFTRRLSVSKDWSCGISSVFCAVCAAGNKLSSVTVGKTVGAAVIAVTAATQAVVGAGVMYSTTGAPSAYVTAGAGVMYSATGVSCTFSTTTGGTSKTVCGFCRSGRSDLDRLHNFHLCHPTDKCSAQILRGLSTLDHLDLWDINDMLNDLQLWKLYGLVNLLDQGYMSLYIVQQRACQQHCPRAAPC